MAKPAEIKTKENDASVLDFLNGVAEEQKRKDSFVILEMMKKATGLEPKMWGASVIGFGNIRYKSPASGREVDWLKIGFSPRKANLSLFPLHLQAQAEMLEKLGKHKTGVGCLYINKLEDINLKVLEEIITTAAKNN
ncbi:DUF1801 domain-containing protein [Flavobacterium sangjuense]|uniref:YdhG-like domain-containing protein n=1 Tax=Flavobacterium sangjuense TaxID=2518177 RepID=A0A4P7PV78_9FLAO|nr:DUF1801 domain-containing protein [Flavobacterium sangjuense]QBZ98182.1 hypothetical protein GS03_01687 [Flavobacterium sangjuense]